MHERNANISRERMARGIAIGLLGSASMLGTALVSPDQSVDVSHQTVAVQTQADHPLDSGLPSTSVTALRTVTDIVDHPVLREYDAFSFPAKRLPVHNLLGVATDEQMQGELGLTYYDGYQFLRDNDLETGSHDFAEYLSAAQEFAGLYGVSVKLLTANDSVPYIAPTATADLRSYKSRNAVTSIITQLGTLSTEYAHDSGLRTIYLGDIDEQYGAGGLALNDGPHDTILVNMAVDLKQDTIIHEINHLWTAATPLSEQIVFDDANGGDIYTGKPKNPASQLVLEDYNSAYAGQSACDTPTAEQIRAKKLLAVRSRYSLKSATEDTAELGVSVVLGKNAVYDQASPILRTKALGYLSGVDQIAPATAEYLAFQTSSSRDQPKRGC